MKSGVETQNHEPRADLESAMDEFEKTRLAYVAVTRARDHLIVSCHHKAGKNAAKTYGGRFWQVFDADERRNLSRRFDWREVVGRHVPERVDPSQLGLALDDRERWIAERRQLLAPFAAPRVMSATGVAQAALTAAATHQSDQLALDIDGAGLAAESAAEAALQPEGIEPYLAEILVDQDDDGADQPVDTVLARRRGRKGSAIGSAVHSVLQLADLGAPARGIDDLVSQQCQIESIPDRTRIVRRLVDAALGSSAVSLAAQHRHIKELFVTAPVGGHTIEGYVDLLIETPQGLVVVDYKTDSVRTDADVDAKLSAYELQAAAYAVALEAVTAETVVECRFVFCTLGGAIERTVVDLDAAKAGVHTTIASLAASAE